MPQSLTIWCNAKYPASVTDRVRRAIGDAKLIQPTTAQESNLVAGGADPLLEQADIAWGQPDPVQSMNLPHLKWIQLTSAGYTRYDTPEFRAAMKRQSTFVCNASSVYAEPCAQHALAMMISLARRIPHAQDNQRTDRAWPTLKLRGESVLLNGQTVLLIGYGAIARRLAELLAPLHMNLIGFRRNPKGDEGTVRIRAIGELDAHLPHADHVVNILPASPETDSFFTADRFVKMKRSSIYYNIARGSTNDESALQRALEQKQLAAAYIDATDQEPLPPDHPLWRTPNCFITPHTAGGHSTESERHGDLFLENFQRRQNGESLIDRII